MPLNEGFARMFQNIGLKPAETSNMDVQITGFRNVYHPTDDTVEIVKEEEHNGKCLEKVFEGINSVLTVSEIETIDEEVFATTAYDNMVMVFELLERLELCLISGWRNPRTNQEDKVFSAMDGLVMNLIEEVERELFGWRFATFQDFGGPTLLRNITTRFKLVEQARDIIRKLYKISKSDDVPVEDKLKIVRFIEDTASEVSIGFGLDSWFDNAVDLISNLDVAIYDGEFTGLFGVDLEAFRGSVPDLEVLRGETSNLEDVIVFGSGTAGMKDLDASEIEADEMPDLTIGTESSDEIDHFDLELNRSVECGGDGGLMVTWRFETSADFASPNLHISEEAI